MHLRDSADHSQPLLVVAGPPLHQQDDLDDGRDDDIDDDCDDDLDDDDDDPDQGFHRGQVA